MAKRFSKLRYLIKTAKRMGIDVSADDNIKAYKAYRAGDGDYKTTAVKRGDSQPISLVPFCVVGYTTKYVVSMSGRSFKQMGTLGVTEARLNIDSGTLNTTNTSQGKKIKGFIPAKAIVSSAVTSAVTTPKSQITLLEYNKLDKKSYTFPFGSQNVDGQKTQLDMQGYLYADLAKGTKNVSFKPEKPA